MSDKFIGEGMVIKVMTHREDGGFMVDKRVVEQMKRIARTTTERSQNRFVERVVIRVNDEYRLKAI